MGVVMLLSVNPWICLDNRPMYKQHFWKMHFRVKNPVGQENQFLRSGFFRLWKCGAILLKGFIFFFSALTKSIVIFWRNIFYLGASTYDVRWFWVIFDLPTYPNQIIYYISLFSKIRYSLTYLPTLKSDVICGCSLI